MDSLFKKLDDRTARVAVLGQGYVGLVVAMRASEAGFDVVGLEVDERRVESLRAGRSYVEDVSDETLQAALDRGYLPTAQPADLAGFDVAVISVPTPLTQEQPDLSFIEAAARDVGRALRPATLVILESTTYPGTTEEVVLPALEETAPGSLHAGTDFLLGYSPERIDPGNPQFSLQNTPKVVSGIDAASLHAVEMFYSAFVSKVVPVSSTGAAELSKLIENTFRHVNIALVNEMAMFAGDLDIDVWEAIDAAATKPFGFMPFKPGPGVGGHCLPIDPTYLSWRVRHRLGETFRFVELANDLNAHMPGYVVRRIQALLNRRQLPVNGSNIVVLGVAYKGNSGDARESPSIPIIDQLASLGAKVTSIDPHVDPLNLPTDHQVRLERTLDPAKLRAADLVVLVTDHEEFDYDLVVRESQQIFDTRNRLASYNSGNVEHL